MRTNILFLFLSLPTSTVGFVVVQQQKQQQHPSKSHSHSRLNGCVITWSDYQSEHLGSLIDAGVGVDVDLVPFDARPDATLSKTANSRAYWLSKVKEDKAKLRGMKPQADVAEWSHAATPTENWVHYRQALEALVPHRVHTSGDAFHWPKHASLASWLDYREMLGGLAIPEVDLDKKQVEKERNEKRPKADAYWQVKYKDEKEKQIHSTKATKVGTPFSKDVNLDTWDHYKHDFIESIPPQKSPIEQELEELRKQAAQFKALALAETVGHTLAEEALHEAEERAASCEIAEAVLIGSAAGGERRAAEEKEEGGAGI